MTHTAIILDNNLQLPLKIGLVKYHRIHKNKIKKYL